MKNYNYLDDFGQETDDYYTEIRQSELKRRLRARGITMFFTGASVMFAFLWMMGWFFEL